MVSIDGIDYEFKRLHRYVEIARALMHKPKGSFYHFSFITRANKIYAIGFNNIAKPSKLVKFPLGGRHSEADVVEGLDDLNIIRKATLINLRLNPKGELRNSFPCEICFEFIKKLGFKRLYYTRNDGFAYMDLRLS